MGYEPLEKKGYQYCIVFLKGRREQASELLPLVHKAISLPNRWLLGTHQGAVSHEHLDYYLDEFVFRFNRRSSRSRGKLFYRLVQQAVAVDPTPSLSLPIGTPKSREPKPQNIGVTGEVDTPISLFLPRKLSLPPLAGGMLRVSIQPAASSPNTVQGSRRCLRFPPGCPFRMRCHGSAHS